MVRTLLPFCSSQDAYSIVEEAFARVKLVFWRTSAPASENTDRADLKVEVMISSFPCAVMLITAFQGTPMRVPYREEALSAAV